jgi:glycosyltransferase involved in cell wall biosynthesis
VELPSAEAKDQKPAAFARQLQSGEFFLYLGRVDINKGVKELTEWFLDGHGVQSGRDASGSYTLALAGTPVMKVPLHPAVHLLGEVDESQKNWLVGNCVALILPSLYESLSLSALEAWAHGKAVVARRGSKVMERHIQDSGGGLLFDDADSLGALPAR